MPGGQPWWRLWLSWCHGVVGHGVSIVLILREIAMKLFEAEIGTAEDLSLSALFDVLGAMRIGSVLVFQRDRTMLEPLVNRESLQRKSMP